MQCKSLWLKASAKCINVNVHVLDLSNKALKREVFCVLCSQVNVLICRFVLLCYLIVFHYILDFNIQCRVCYTACSVNRRGTVSLFKFPIKSLMIPFELN